MSTNTSQTTQHETSSGMDGVIDAARHAAHLSHEARAVKTLAEDAIEECVHAARRAVRRTIAKLKDFKDESVHQVKRQPLKAISVAAGGGLVLGLVAGWMIVRFSSRRNIG